VVSEISPFSFYPRLLPVAECVENARSEDEADQDMELLCAIPDHSEAGEDESEHDEGVVQQLVDDRTCGVVLVAVVEFLVEAGADQSAQTFGLPYVFLIGVLDESLVILTG